MLSARTLPEGPGRASGGCVTGRGCGKAPQRCARGGGAEHSLPELFRGLNAWEGEAVSLVSGSFVSLCVELHQRLAAFT